jgi:hypothetical protein
MRQYVNHYNIIMLFDAYPIINIIGNFGKTLTNVLLDCTAVE